jgi:antitoxin VapB
MALSIKNEQADRLARELSDLTGESLTEAVVISLKERLDRKRAHQDNRPLTERIAEIARAYSQLPVLDDRAPEEILGYDENGLPT